MLKDICLDSKIRYFLQPKNHEYGKRSIAAPAQINNRHRAFPHKNFPYHQKQPKYLQAIGYHRNLRIVKSRLQLTQKRNRAFKSAKRGDLQGALILIRKVSKIQCGSSKERQKTRKTHWRNLSRWCADSKVCRCYSLVVSGF